MIDPLDKSNANLETLIVSPVNRLRGELRLPGDKSISHRAAMLSSLARGVSTLENFSSADDCAATLSCLEALGVRIVRNGSSVAVEGNGPSGLKQPAQTLNAQNSGTTMRLLAGILAGQPFATTITGDESLRARPMNRVAEPLRLFGARVELEPDGCAPLRISGRRPLQAIHYQLPIASAQIKSAVLLAALSAVGITTVTEPAATRDHTERLLQEFGVPVERNGNTLSIQGGATLQARALYVPGDISSAACFIGATIALPGSDLIIRDVGLNPTRTGYLTALRTLGADISIAAERLEGREPVGALHVRGHAASESRMLDVCGADVSKLIDELPLLAFVAASIGAEMQLRDAGELRVKECDRIAATVANLKRLGARIDEHDDGWQLYRGEKLQGAELSSFGDHRIAMAAAVAALAAKGPSQLAGARNSVAVSLPEFWTLLDSVTE